MKIFTFLSGSSRARQALAGVVALGLALPAVALSQSEGDSAAYARAREMVANGEAAKGRRLADSVAAAAPAGSSAYAEGLFWRAMLAENAKDSERYYRQIIVDYPLSGRVSDALLRIGQLESARGDNAAALQHFQRLVLEHPESPLRPEASYWVSQMYFKANDASRACTANADALANVKPTNVELKNRIDFQQQRCRGVALATTPAAKTSAPVTVPVDRAPPADAARETARQTAPRVAKQTEPKATAKTDAKADVKTDVKAESAAARARLRDSIATEKALARVKAESISIAKAAQTRALASARAKADAETARTAARAAAQTPGRQTPKAADVDAGHSGAVTREPTREEVARALESADTPLGKKVAANMAAKSTETTGSATAAKGSVKASVKATAKTTAKSTAKTARETTATSGTGSGMFAVQIAAFGTKEAANELVAKMRGRGYDAYVDGGAAPYRVRMGHYTKYASASAALAKLKAKHIDGFVAER